MRLAMRVERELAGGGMSQLFATEVSRNRWLSSCCGEFTFQETRSCDALAFR